MKDRKRWGVVGVYAAAMAWVESAVVFYVRTMIDRVEPYQAEPLPLVGSLGEVELVREVATLTMLLSVGLLAGRTWRTRLGYSAIAFGVWDILYYGFLKVMCGWPHSVFDWDILFLLPLPWWGPVLAPVSIAVLLVLWGTLATQYEPRAPSRSQAWTARGLIAAGMVLALYTFMADTLAVAGQGVEVVRRVLPAQFNWRLFTLALVLMAAPVLQQCRELWVRRQAARAGVQGACAQGGA